MSDHVFIMPMVNVARDVKRSLQVERRCNVFLGPRLSFAPLSMNSS